jgi:hypothetical protein
MENFKETIKDHAYNQGIICGESHVDELEGIVTNEPKNNKYETVKFHKLNIFPYYLIGKVISKFDFSGTNKYLNGVGMLIAPDIVLTVAHNLCHMSNKDEILITKRVLFFAAAHGDFNLFEPVKSINTYIPENYINALKTDNREEQLYNDWGLIFLSAPIGNYVTQILDVDRSSNYIKLVDGLYSFFVNNENLNLSALTKIAQSEKISIVGYTEYKENYKNNTAYKFIKNFNKNIDESELNEAGKININININTSETEGLISSSRYYKNTEKKNTGVQGIDYIVLGNEEYNRDFDNSDADKLIMCESKGFLKMDEEFGLKSIRYRISTYKGQSGSPIFIRSRLISEKDSNMKVKPSYIYKFIGLHSRRGPSSEDKFYESEKLNNLTENLMTCETTEKSDISKNEIIKQNGICDYNIALSIMGESIRDIRTIVSRTNREICKTLIKTDFVSTRILLNTDIKVNGVFKKNLPLSTLFNFGSKIFNVPKEYILLKEIASGSDIPNIHNYNFDQNKKLTEIIKEDEEILTLELMLNIKKYGEFMSNTIIQKFLENYDLEEKQLKTDFQKYMKKLFHSIFQEITSFENNLPTYGKLFKKIRKMILSKLGIHS